MRFSKWSCAPLFLAYCSIALAANMGTAFTYQGYLENPPGTPLNGSCSFEFKLCDDAVAGCAPGTISNHPGVSVSNGNFTVSNIDFGANSINGTARWMEISLNCGNPGDPITLEPRVELKPVPHALALPGLYTQQNTNADDLINLIGGYTGNSVTPDAWSATISGGGSAGLPNRVTDHYGTVGGGSNNQAGDNAGPTDDRRFATVGGGASNRASGEYSTVGGGIANIGSGHYATVGGGIGNTASEESSTVAGGVLNTASNLQSTVGGGLSNTASGQLSVVPGGWQNVAGGYYSFAAGRRAKVRDPAASLDSDGDAGTFMWADSTDADFISTGPDRFLVRASNGSAIYSSAALTAGVSLAAGGGSWSSVSDRNLKENIRQVDAREVLERLRTVPVTTWNYKSQNASIRHIGPMGQDFYSAFGVGEEDTKIATADVDGVALAAIQGLHQLVQEKDCEIGVLENEIESLKSQISNLKELEARLARLEARSGNH